MSDNEEEPTTTTTTTTTAGVPVIVPNPHDFEVKEEQGELPPDDQLALMVAEQMRLRDEALELVVDEHHPFPLLEADNMAEMLKQRKIRQLRASSMGLDEGGKHLDCD